MSPVATGGITSGRATSVSTRDFPRHDFLIDAAGVPYLALAVLAVYSCARSLRLRPGLALLVAALYAYTPAVALHATSCNNDLPIAAAFLLLCALALDGWRRGGHGLRRGVIAWLVIGLAFGTKAYIAFVAPGLVWLAFWCWLKSPARARAFRPPRGTSAARGGRAARRAAPPPRAGPPSAARSGRIPRSTARGRA